MTNYEKQATGVVFYAACRDYINCKFVELAADVVRIVLSSITRVSHENSVRYRTS